MRYVLLALPLLLVSACATPQTILQNKKGDVVTCGGDTGGSLAGGPIGYNIQKDNDKACVEAYKKKGYKIIKQSGE